jgi:hypothetical protein
VPVGEHVGSDHDLLAEDALHGIAPAVDLGSDGLDDDAYWGIFIQA